MPTQPDFPLNPAGPNPATVVEALGGWVQDDDLALGCECADPALHIEMWQCEAAARGVQPM
jgi:hypothetical protein